MTGFEERREVMKETPGDGEDHGATSPHLLMIVGLLTLLMCLLLTALPDGVSANGTGDFPPPASGDWVISSPTSVWDEELELNGSLLVQSGGSLELDRVWLTINNSYEGEHRIEVADGGQMGVNSSEIMAKNSTKPYYMIVRQGGRASISGTVLEDLGWKEAALYEQKGLVLYSDNATVKDSTIRNSWIGIRIEGASPRILGTNITDNEFGIWARGPGVVDLIDNRISNNDIGLISESATVLLTRCVLASNALVGINSINSDLFIDNSTISGDTNTGIQTSGSGIMIVNGSISGEMVALVLKDNSTVQSINTTFSMYDLEFKDYLSRLSTYWHMDVEVLWWSDRAPVANASVGIRDNGGSWVINGTTGGDGIVRSMLVPGYDANRSGFEHHTPVNITVNRSNLTANVSLEVHGALNTTILMDDLPPGVNVTTPRSGDHINHNDLLIKGSAWDNETGPSTVMISIDGGDFTDVNGTAIWSINVTLMEGSHNITIRVRDGGGNTGEFLLPIIIDTVDPVITIHGPMEGHVTNLTWIWVNGTVESGANLSVDEEPVENENGTFGFYFQLEEGENPIRLKAFDRAGNKAITTINVTKDTTVDPLIITPGNDTSTNQVSLVLNGSTEAGTFIEIEWDAPAGNNTTSERRNLTLWAGPDGNFSVTVELLEGDNLVEIFARDFMNNTKTLNLTYYLDSTPPKLVLTSPDEMFHFTNRNGVNIKGETEDGATVHLNGQQLQLYGMMFSIRAEVFLGQNNFTIVALDPAGNSERIDLIIIVDKDPPPLNISRPYDPIVKTKGAYFTITGFAEGNATVVVNGVPYDVRSDGYFAIKRSLVFGENRFVITAKDQAGNPTTVDRIVIREKPDPDMTMFYIGLSIPLIVIAIVVASVLFHLHRTGRLENIKASISKRREEREMAEVEGLGKKEGGDEELDVGMDLPEPGGGEGDGGDELVLERGEPESEEGMAGEEE